MAAIVHNQWTLLRSMCCLCWHSGMPLCRIQTVSPVLQHRQAAPNPAASNWLMTWMDSSMKKMILPHPLTCAYWLFFGVLLLQGVAIHFTHFVPLPRYLHFPLLVFNVAHFFFIWWLFNFPIEYAPIFFPFPPFGCNVFFFCFCNYYVF